MADSEPGWALLLRPASSKQGAGVFQAN